LHLRKNGFPQESEMKLYHYCKKYCQSKNIKIMKSSQIVTFVVDKDLDIKNHLIGFDVYKRNKEKIFHNSKTKGLKI
jgi:hypothetical protein